MTQTQIKYLSIGDEVRYNNAVWFISDIFTESGAVESPDSVLLISSYSDEDDTEVFMKELS